jgi:hypothetical protein
LCMWFLYLSCLVFYELGFMAWCLLLVLEESHYYLIYSF